MPADDHDPADPSDARLTDLEIKLSFTEDLVEHLNAIVARQQQTLDTMQHELRLLRQQLQAQDSPAGPRSLRDELPPHY